MNTISTQLSALRTLPELLAFRVAQSPQGEAYREFDAATGQWKATRWAEAGGRIAQWSQALAAMQLPRQARIAVLLPNGLDAVCIDQAALSRGLVPVPLHAIDNPGSIAYILSDCDACVLMVPSLAQWRAIESVGLALPALRQVVVTAREALPAGIGPVSVILLADWLAAGQGTAHAAQPPAEDELSAIVYTSGTTGKPKGVMLTHRNVVSNVLAILERVVPTAGDVFLSFLPLSHTFERTAGYYLPLAVGSCVAYARSVALLAEDLKTVRPTVLVSVPRIYERVFARLHESLAGSAFRTRLFNAAQAVGWRRFCKVQGLPLAAGEGSAWAMLDPLLWPFLDRLVARKLRAQFGGRVRVAVSGGAPLSHAVARCFLGLGVPLLQGYGMTETSPVVAANGVDDNDPATVGRALPGIEVRIGDNRELQVRGPSVMKGYWKRAEDTARVLTPDGWLSTGDQADIQDGRIRIMGRIKEIIVTSTGEKVPPGDLELAIAVDPLFAQVMVVGENRPFIGCVAVVNKAEWQRLAASLGLDPIAAASLSQPAVRKAALARIAIQTRDFARYAAPRAIFLTLEPWTIENTFMTPTLKLKRNNLMARYADEIDAMYRSPDRNGTPAG
ncbi:AMP-dependent synthetase/ligase [Polaromonas naphthalenivorans]|uniref:AMP-dependent synthetase and ligase n=1 Tax=Polaromonas naphthalenivorans (strain CJ2) TaxID=365044 RepID=A1VLF6_POLNA|nr:long-chain fatty acid--CoA ligase [Polaromonas naphthalenivorans]ABM36484.1 AMP-dependent synthetase and ligase [Polaromonas naphthalenivorans CJ2]